MRKGRLNKAIFCAATVACAAVLTLLVLHHRHVGYYEAVAVIRPTLEVQENDTNACYWTKEILSADDFDDIIYNETNDKQICLHVYMHDSIAAIDRISAAIVLTEERCSTSGIKSAITKHPYIARTPSLGQYICYAGLSLIFSILVAGAILMGRKIIAKY